MSDTGHIFIGGIGLTQLRVYEQRPAPDGIMSGCAHAHAITSEAYYVVSGSGAIELHDVSHGFRTVPLTRGDYVEFSPGTLHRSVSTGALEVLALMGMGGLAERGDARIYFGKDIDDDPAEFQRLTALPQTAGLHGALERRDASVRAYMDLLHAWSNDRDAYFSELSRFINLHRVAVCANSSGFDAVIERGLEHEANALRERMNVNEPLLLNAKVVCNDKTPETFGMCGMLRQLASPVAV